MNNIRPESFTLKATTVDSVMAILEELPAKHSRRLMNEIEGQLIAQVAPAAADPPAPE